jgi:hypothetical protein
MILVQTLSQPMMTKKWRKNFAAPFCGAERQQPALSPESAIQPPGTIIFLADCWSFARKFIVFARAALWRAAFAYRASHRCQGRLAVKIVDESCFLARSLIVKSDKWKYSYH